MDLAGDLRSDDIAERQPRSPAWLWVGLALVVVSLYLLSSRVDTDDSSCGPILWDPSWTGVCEDTRGRAATAVFLGALGLIALIVSARRRLVAVVLCGAFLAFLGTVNRLADHSEQPTYCGSVINQTVYELDPGMNDACDRQLASRKAQAATAATTTVGLLVSAVAIGRRKRTD